MFSSMALRSKRRRHPDGVEGSLPMDLILIILVQLPVSSLLRFRCVCKSWLSLISSPEFANEYLIYSKHSANRRLRALINFGGMFVDHCPISLLFDSPKFYHSVVRTKPPFFVEVVGSSNGLVCLYFKVTTNPLNKHKKPQLLIWNPSTRKCKSLPPFGVLEKHLHLCRFGFEFDPSINNYKVIALFTSKQYSTVIKSYTFDSTTRDRARRRWKIIGLTDKICSYRHRMNQDAFGKGKFYFNRSYLHTISSFHAESKKLQAGYIHYPDFYDIDWSFSVLAICEQRRRLHLLKTTDTSSVVWILEDEEHRLWTKLCTIDHRYHGIVHSFQRGFMHDECTLRLLNDGIIMVHTSGDKFLIYNPKDDSLIVSELVDCLFRHFVGVITYFESLTWI